MIKRIKYNLICMLAFVACLFVTACGASNSSVRPSVNVPEVADTDNNSQGGILDSSGNNISSNAQRLYVIQSIESEGERIFCHSITTGKELKYDYSLATKFLDADGKSCSSLRFVPGTVVTFGDFLPRNGAVSCVQIADGFWSQDNIKRFSIDEERGIFKIGSTNYKLTNNTFVFSDKDEIKISEISDNDILRVYGKDKEIISVAVTTGHGTVRIYNSGVFVDSVICIGNKHMAYIDGDMDIEVPEGTYEITVANDGWGGSAEYIVVRGETTEVDLNDLKGDGPSYCKVTFDVTVPGTIVYLDNQVVDTDEVQEVRYGRHLLKVSAAGYTDWARTLIVNSRSATIALDFLDEQKTNTANNSSSNSNSNNNNTVSNSGTNNTGNSTNNNSNNNTGNNNSNTNTNSGSSNNTGNTSSTVNKTNPELDYLNTLSDLLTNML